MNAAAGHASCGGALATCTNASVASAARRRKPLVLLRRLRREALAHRADDVIRAGEPAVAEHRVHEVAVYGDLEGSVVPGDELDGREAGAELAHQRVGQRERLRLVAAFGAVRDRDLDGPSHAPARA